MNAKQIAGERSAEYVRDGMTVGLGTGSTAKFAIEAIGRRVAEGLNVRGVATSVASETLARGLAIPLLDLNDVERIDVTVDGADEIDPQFDMIKGGGGALLREKMVAACTEMEVIVVDPSKEVDVLGRGFALPVEVLPFGWRTAARALASLGCAPELRMAADTAFRTDGGHFILDCKFDEIADPAALEPVINNIPGVIENGLFVGLADVLIVGRDDGQATVRTRA